MGSQIVEDKCPSKIKMAQKRRALTLDLNAAAVSKKSKIATQHILTSPDVQKMKLSSPELAEFLTRNPTLATPTPSGVNYLFPKTVTEEQERYVQGFEDALKNLQQTNPGDQVAAAAQSAAAIETIERATAAHSASRKLVPSPRPSSSASGSMDSSELRIKEELDEEDLDDDLDDEDFDEDDSEEEEQLKLLKNKSSGSSSKRSRLSVNPIDMVSQERIKLERKRARNRLAASKCRKRKLERISQLEYKVKDLKGENTELGNVVKKLKETVYSLKQQVIEHANNGCQINMANEVTFS